MVEETLDDKVYATHLSKISSTNKVVSTEDIFSSGGVLLVSKNTVIDDKTSVNLVKHKLKKSVSLSIAIEHLIDEKKVYADFQEYLKNNPELQLVHEKLALNKDVQMGCLYLMEFPLLRQKLTVMQQNLPELYRKSIAGAWFALAIEKQLGQSQPALKQALLAGLIRDVGMMHIEPELLKESSDNSKALRKLIMSHVLIGKLVLDEVDSLPLLIKRAIFEHHERSDGAGYPKGKQSDELSQLGLVLAMADTIQEILQRYKRQGKNIASLEGFFILNTSTYGEAVYKSLMQLVKLTGVSANRVIPDEYFADFIDKLVETNQVFLRACILLAQLDSQLNTAKPCKEEQVVKNFIQRIVSMRVASGVPSQEYCRWIEYVRKNKIQDAYGEMEMLGMMFDELAWQLDQIRLFINALFQSDNYDQNVKNLMDDCLQLIKQALKITEFAQVRG